VLVRTGKGRETERDPALPAGTEVLDDLAALAAQLLAAQRSG
jgi:hypothetical protein